MMRLGALVIVGALARGGEARAGPEPAVDAEARLSVDGSDGTPSGTEGTHAPGASFGSLEATWEAIPPDQLHEEAVERRKLGDYEGAEARLRYLAARQDGPSIELALGITLELEERYADALGCYDAVLAKWPNAPEATNAAFRRALVLGDLGRHAESLAQVRALLRRGEGGSRRTSPRKSWTERDRQTLELVRGVEELDSGHVRRGLRRIHRTLVALQGTDAIPWIRARARAAVVHHLLDEAASIPLVGNKRAARNLKRRAALMSQAEDQVIAIARLKQVEYALLGVEQLGDAYMRLHDDMLAAPPPHRLTDEQVAIYRQEVASKAKILQAKAWRFYDEGVSLALRSGWQGHLAHDLKARRDAIDPLAPPAATAVGGESADSP